MNVLGCLDETAESRVNSLRTPEVGPQIRINRNELAASEVRVMPAPRTTAMLRGVDSRHLLEGLGGRFVGLRVRLRRCVAHGSLDARFHAAARDYICIDALLKLLGDRYKAWAAFK